MNETIEKNLELMKSNERGGMHRLLMKESFGGNAGFWHNCSCAGANFYYDRKTGEIKYFENIQNVPKHIIENFDGGIFRVALETKTWKMHIVDYWAPKESSTTAKKNLEDAVRLYNKEFGFSEEELNKF